MARGRTTILAPALQIFDTEERERLLYRLLDENQRKVIEERLERLLSHKV